MGGANVFIQKLDESWDYKSITTAEAAEQGIYRKIHRGIEVPYPQLHPELAHEANKTNDPSDPRTPSKRKAANMPDDEPSPKRPASQPTATAIPRHIGGLLSAVVPDEPPSQPASPSANGSEDGGSPTPDERAAPGKPGPKPKAPRAAAASGETPDVEVDNNNPPLPAGAGEPDEHGVRLVTKRARGNDPGSTRIMVPPLFEYDSLEIGFRDSTNDSSRNATKSKRKRFLNTPNTNNFQYDRIVGGYDMTTYEEGDLCQETIQKYNLHPKFGIFLRDSINEEEPPRPYVFGHDPVVFVADNGKVQHTSRSVAAVKASNMQQVKLKSAMQMALDAEEIGEEELRDEEYQRLVKERDERRLKQKQLQDAAQQKESHHTFSSTIDVLLAAAAALEEEGSAETQNPKSTKQSASPVVVRPSTRSRNYDAVRDIIDGSEEAATTSTKADNEAATALMMLANIALGDAEASSATDPAAVLDLEAGPKPDSAIDPAPIHVAGQTQQLTIQMPEPVHPRQLRDPSELEQHGQLVKFTSDNPFLPEPLAPQLPQYTSREHGFEVQPPQHYLEHQSHQSPLAAPDIFAYREPGYDQLPGGQMQPPRAQPYMNQQGSRASMGADSHSYGEAEARREPPQLRRPSQMSQDDQYAPARPNTEDVAFLDPQVDPQLSEGAQRQEPSRLQAPQPEQRQKSQSAQSSSVLQQPQNNFFLTALNSPAVSPPQDRQQQHQQSDYAEPPPAHQQLTRPLPTSEGSPGRTPFAHPNGAEQQSLRPLHRSSGSLMAPAAQAPAPPHMMMTPGENSDNYPQQQPQFYNQGYQSNGFAPPEQANRPSGYMAQPMMHPAQQPPPPPYPQYASSGHMASQKAPQYSYAGLPGSAEQSPPPFGNESGGPPSPSLRAGSTPTGSRNKNKRYLPIVAAPLSAEKNDGKGSQDRPFVIHPFQGSDATSVPPSQGPTQIRGWTAVPGYVHKKPRGKNSMDSQIDPALGQGEKK